MYNAIKPALVHRYRKLNKRCRSMYVRTPKIKRSSYNEMEFDLPRTKVFLKC